MRRFLVAACLIALLVPIVFVFFPRLIQQLFTPPYIRDLRKLENVSKCVSLYLADRGASEVPVSFALSSLATTNPPYLSPDHLIDCFGRPFVIEVPGRDGAKFTIVSYGFDGVPGGMGADVDLFAD